MVRNQVDFAFYGGRTKATEKRTKVKSRVMANAFRELIADAGEVYIMGHSFADMDAVGAAAGICCAARKRGKQARIVIDREHTAAETLIARLDALPEYSGVFLPLLRHFCRCGRHASGGGGYQPSGHGGKSPAFGILQPGGGH